MLKNYTFYTDYMLLFAFTLCSDSMSEMKDGVLLDVRWLVFNYKSNNGRGVCV